MRLRSTVDTFARLLAATLAAAGCSLDSAGKASSSAASLGGSGSGSTNGTGTPATSGGPGTSAGSPSGGGTSTTATTTPGTTSTTAATTSSPGTTTADGTSGSSGSTTGAFDCMTPAPYEQLTFVDPSTTPTESPMQIVPPWGGLSVMHVAYSAVGDMGAITFPVTVPCKGTYWVWGLVWDKVAGVASCNNTANADNLWVSVDGGPEAHWAYGCETCSDEDNAWNWNIVQDYQASPCNVNAVPIDLDPGAHQVRVRNLEGGTFDPPDAPDVAGIAAVAIANHMDFDPNTQFMP